MEQLLTQTKEKMNKALSHLDEELKGVRTGRATPALIEGVKVAVYGSPLNLRDVASVNAPEPRMLLVQPWDPNNTDAVAKAIREAGLGFNPIVEANLVRVPVPELTEERRNELTKLVSEKAEGARVALRAIRREAMETIDKEKKNSQISEDEQKRHQEQVQKITDEDMKTLEERVKSKQAELAQI
ncbi:MAG: ribosome recycling factor [bacterium]|nr:ribosome recycling factor [bacterium]